MTSEKRNPSKEEAIISMTQIGTDIKTDEGKCRLRARPMLFGVFNKKEKATTNSRIGVLLIRRTFYQMGRLHLK